MNIVPRHAVRLVAICAFATAFAQLASGASDSGNGAAFQLAMGPMSAAQKNQGNTARSDGAVVPRRHTRRRHAHHAR